MPTRMAKEIRLTLASTGENTEQLDLLYIVGGDVKGYSHFGNTFGSFLQN